MNCRACIKLPIDVDGTDASVDTQIMTPPYILLVHLVDLDHIRNTDIVTLKKEKGDTSS